MRGMTFTLSLLLSLATGCIVEAPTGDRGGPESTRSGAARVRDTTPMVVKLGAQFGGVVELMAASVQPAQLAPGEQSRVALFFKALEPPGEDYTIFVHAEDSNGSGDRMNLDHKPMGGKMPTSQWKKGETVKDEFAVYLPAGSPLRGVTLWVGLWEPKSDRRVPVSAPGSARTDGKDRVMALQLSVAP